MLLRNAPFGGSKKQAVLPLKKVGTIALVGPLADNKQNMPGTWSVAANFENAISLFKGLSEAVGDKVKILTARGSNLDYDSLFEERAGMFGKSLRRDNRTPATMIAEAVEIAKQSDVIIAAVGESSEMSGESSSRADIGIPKAQQDLLKALIATGKPIVLVLFTGRPLTLTWEQANIPAILNVWFAGSEAGYAIADVLFGNINPSGKLTTSFPQHVGQVPLYYAQKNTGRPLNVPWFSKFRSNYLDVSNDPLYPFGYGLSYTSFTYGDIQLSNKSLKADDTLYASVSVTNTGNYFGKEIVQLYIRDLVGSVSRPLKELKGFDKIGLNPGETRVVKFQITTEDLKFYDYDLKHTWESGDFEIMIGPNSVELKKGTVNWVK